MELEAIMLELLVDQGVVVLANTPKQVEPEPLTKVLLEVLVVVDNQPHRKIIKAVVVVDQEQ
tara:strand:+ start:107 stop:292 length:186 start_codon:yes stop_codon:yes gene_type:complete